jgi:hypothetical protein
MDVAFRSGVALTAVAAAGLLAGGCGGSAAVRLADRGDYAGLREALGARERAGDLSNDEAASIARSVVAEAIRSAPAGGAAQTVRSVWACARDVDGALADRMARHDEGGAQAALARLDARSLEPEDVKKYRSDPEAHWRAVGARSLVGDDDEAARHAALVDGSPLVRRQAARAAHEAADVRDYAALSEVARLDPEPIVRTEAVRALAALPAAPGADVADLLRDLWTTADDALREDIAIAWASRPVWGAGGREALRVLVASGRGPGVLEGAAAILRRPDDDAEVDGIAAGVLARAIEEGSRRERLQAIAEAPLADRRAPLLRAAIERAAGDTDLEVRVSALARLAEARVDGAVGPLEALAQPGSPVADRARFALAAAGDRRVQAWLEQDLAAERPESRLFAADALVTLGVGARAAPLLADSDVSVRLRAACTIAGGVRFRR